MLARPERFELPTPWFVAKYSIQLSYGREGADYSRRRPLEKGRLEPFPVQPHLMERHPLGSQAFVPLAKISFVVVVAPAGEWVRAEDLRAFVTDGTQGVNYFRGTWHMPLIALEAGQSFLVIDRGDEGPDANPNCDEVLLGRPVTLVRE